MSDTGAAGRIRVVIVDDQALMRTGFRMILESEPDIDVVGEAEDGDRAIDEVRRTRPDVVLMDIRMPVLDGVEATRRLAGPDVHDPTRILILTTFDLDEYVYEAVRAGASGFLLKDTPPEDLIAAVRVIHRGEALLAPRVTRTLIEEFARHSAPATTTSHPGVELLTGRERDVLVELARGRSNREIAESLFVGETTVKTHVGHIFTKLEVRDRAQAVVAAYESGLVRPGDS